MASNRLQPALDRGTLDDASGHPANTNASINMRIRPRPIAAMVPGAGQCANAMSKPWSLQTDTCALTGGTGCPQGRCGLRRSLLNFGEILVRIETAAPNKVC